MLDGRTHLVKQGWKGTGHPLKEGGRSRPIVIAQKKTLGGIGKDRDESFAFWDHLYDVAAKSIKFKIPAKDAESSSDQEEETSVPTFHRTQTGILSNRRPTSLPTPSSSKSPSPPPPSTSIISRAKQEAARRSLYSRFLRGPLITQESLESESTISTTTTIKDATLSIPAAISPPSISTISSSADICTAQQEAADDIPTRKAERAARKQARAERREAKALRRTARAEEKARKAEEAAHKAAKLQKKAEKESKRLLRATYAKTESIIERGDALGATAKVAASTDGEQKRKDKKKRKRDTA